MNAEVMIKRIKREIGLYGIALPIENLDKLILEILEDTTIPVFSIYSPKIEMITVNIKDFTHNNSDRGEGCDLYILPEYIFAGDRELLYILSVKYNESYLRPHYFPTVMTKVNAYDAIESAMLANAEKPIIDSMVKPITWHYEHPKRLYIYDALISTQLIIKAGMSHDHSLQSIPPTAAESFFNLAILDVMNGLYATIKHYNGIETPFGRVELNIDDWKEAKNERKELLKEWDEVYLNDLLEFSYGA